MFRVPRFTEAEKVKAAQELLHPVGRQELCSVTGKKAVPAETTRWTLMTPRGNKPATGH